MSHCEVAPQPLKGGVLLQQSRAIIVLYVTGMWWVVVGDGDDFVFDVREGTGILRELVLGHGMVGTRFFCGGGEDKK